VPLDVVGQLLQGRREVQNYAVAPLVAFVCVRPVEQSVVDHNGVPCTKGNGALIGLIDGRWMAQVKSVGEVLMGFGKDSMNRRTLMVSARQDPQGAILPSRGRKVAENS